MTRTERPATRQSASRESAEALNAKCSCGGGCPRCNMAGVVLRGELQSPTGTNEPASASADEGAADPMPLDTSACSVNALFLSNVAGGNSKVNCQVPIGQYGAARLAQYRVNGLASIPPGGITVSEKFTAVDDPLSIADKLKPRDGLHNPWGILLPSVQRSGDDSGRCQGSFRVS